MKKKFNNYGFTLIELLAVVVIMGILSVVAVGSVNRIMENTRKDTFINTAKEYTTGAKNMWAADNLQCSATGGDFLSSAVPNDTYYILVDTSSTTYPELLQDGGKSSWGNRHVKGYIKVVVGEKTLSSGEKTREVKFYPVLTDGVHGINVTAGSPSTEGVSPKEGASLVRGDLVMENAAYITALPSSNLCIEV